MKHNYQTAENSYKTAWKSIRGSIAMYGGDDRSGEIAKEMQKAIAINSEDKNFEPAIAAIESRYGKDYQSFIKGDEKNYTMSISDAIRTIVRVNESNHMKQSCFPWTDPDKNQFRMRVTAGMFSAKTTPSVNHSSQKDMAMDSTTFTT